MTLVTSFAGGGLPFVKPSPERHGLRAERVHYDKYFPRFHILILAMERRFVCQARLFGFVDDLAVVAKRSWNYMDVKIFIPQSHVTNEIKRGGPLD